MVLLSEQWDINASERNIKKKRSQNIVNHVDRTKTILHKLLNSIKEYQNVASNGEI